MNDGYSSATTPPKTSTIVIMWNIVCTSPTLHVSLFYQEPEKRAVLFPAPPNRWAHVDESSLSATESWKTGGDNIFGCGNERQKHTAKRRRRRRKDGNRIIKLRTFWERRHRAVFPYWWTKSRRGSSSGNLQLTPPTWRLTQWHSNAPLTFFSCSIYNLVSILWGIRQFIQRRKH